MSEPMSSVEIEDVLSSIRRLVSEDLRPKTEARTLSEANGRANGKLILTPALRVVHDARPEDAGPEDAGPADAGPEDAGPADAGPEDAGPADGADAPTPISAVVAAVAAAVGRQDDDFESVLGEDEPDAGWPPSNWDDIAHAIVSESAAQATGADAAADADQSVGCVQGTAPLPEHQAAEAGIIENALQDDPRLADTAEASVSEGLAEPADRAATAVMAEAEQHAAPDADILRSLVREVLREELAGPLGQRITRNVRKLVRSEIARTLSVRDAE